MPLSCISIECLTGRSLIPIFPLHAYFLGKYSLAQFSTVTKSRMVTLFENVHSRAQNTSAHWIALGMTAVLGDCYVKVRSLCLRVRNASKVTGACNNSKRYQDNLTERNPSTGYPTFPVQLGGKKLGKPTRITSETEASDHYTVRNFRIVYCTLCIG